MSDITLDGRLSSVAKFVRWGARFADIGTDHAYLPVFLLCRGVIERAVCSDINSGPLDNARATARAAGVFDKIDFVLADGASALSGFGITDMAICGMGGELIARIIEDAPYIKENRVRLILQPMTRQEQLRTYLYQNGFSLTDCDYVTEGGKHYTVIVWEYTKEPQHGEITPRVRYGGVCHTSPIAQREYLTSKLNSKLRAHEGIKKGGSFDVELSSDIEYIKKLLGELDLLLAGGTS